MLDDPRTGLTMEQRARTPSVVGATGGGAVHETGSGDRIGDGPQCSRILDRQGAEDRDAFEHT